MIEANKDSKFSIRLKESSWWTSAWVIYLKNIGHFSEIKKATSKEDIENSIDFWVKFKEGVALSSWNPIQFKLRVTPDSNKKDCPVVMRQPFYGCDVGYSDKSNEGLNKLGRDYKGIMGNNSKFYYVAIKNSSSGFYEEIYKIKTSKLKEIVSKSENEWRNVEQFEKIDGVETRVNWFTYREDRLIKERICKIYGMRLLFRNEETQIWLQKNDGERYHKINCYVKESLKEESFMIPQKTAKKINKFFKERKK